MTTTYLIVGVCVLGWALGIGITFAYGRFDQELPDDQAGYIWVCLFAWPLVLVGIAGYRFVCRYRDRG